jgi:hypothetical protein
MIRIPFFVFFEVFEPPGQDSYHKDFILIAFSPIMIVRLGLPEKYFLERYTTYLILHYWRKICNEKVGAA